MLLLRRRTGQVLWQQRRSCRQRRPKSRQPSWQQPSCGSVGRCQGPPDPRNLGKNTRRSDLGSPDFLSWRSMAFEPSRERQCRKSSRQQPPEGRWCLEASTAAQKGACASGAMKVRSAGVLCVSRKPQESCTLLLPLLRAGDTCVHVIVLWGRGVVLANY